jgi:7-carboxy-7-deazaguanine synthase
MAGVAPGLSRAAQRLVIADKRLKPLNDGTPDTLVVHEVYASVQGESTYAGLPCVFVRTTACNLRCRYCDTKHAFVEGSPMTLSSIEDKVASFGIKLVELTGGEPLLQQASFTLMQRLCDQGYTVLLETSGSVDIGEVDPRVIRIVDFKTPYSGEVDANLYANVAKLKATDEVKLVLGDRTDYEWARAFIHEHGVSKRCTVLVGCVWGALDPKDLVAWILADELPVRMQIQMHKVIWDPAKRGV